jgi:hypothetical protein
MIQGTNKKSKEKPAWVFRIEAKGSLTKMFLDVKRKWFDFELQRNFKLKFLWKQL